MTKKRRPIRIDSLPYGIWLQADGTQVMFNRKYEPIWKRRPGEPATKVTSFEWVPHVRQDYLYLVGDGYGPYSDLRNRLLRAERDFAAGLELQVPIVEPTPRPVRSGKLSGKPRLTLINGGRKL
jgi:hypothetical protein